MAAVYLSMDRLRFMTIRMVCGVEGFHKYQVIDGIEILFGYCSNIEANYSTHSGIGRVQQGRFQLFLSLALDHAHCQGVKVRPNCVHLLSSKEDEYVSMMASSLRLKCLPVTSEQQ